jgi:nucleoid DNA-binding protein
MKVYKTDLVRATAKETRLSQRVVAEVLETALATIKVALRRGDSVTFPGFGTFYTRERGEQLLTHIRTGEPITVPAGRQAAFRAGEHLKRAVQHTTPHRGRPRRQLEEERSDAA